jgi:hypothetical protein
MLIGYSEHSGDDKKKAKAKIVEDKQLPASAAKLVEAKPIVNNMAKKKEQAEHYPNASDKKIATGKKPNRPKAKQNLRIRYATSSPINRTKLKSSEFEVHLKRIFIDNL